MSLSAPSSDPRYAPEVIASVKQTCSKCGCINTLKNFVKDSHRKNGYRRICRSCQAVLNKEQHEKHPNQRRDNLRKWRQKNREYVCAYQQHWVGDLEGFEPKGHQVVVEDYEQHKEQRKKYYHENRDQITVSQKRYRAKPSTKAQRSEYQAERARNNPQVRIKMVLAQRIRFALKNSQTSRAGRTWDLLGCDEKFFRSWISHQFANGMSWENHGKNGWHFDHIIPCASFDLTKPEEQRKCFHWSNIQPLWAIDNMRKNDNLFPISDYQI